jgi:hypothetical protein
MSVQAHHCRSCGAMIGWLRTAAGKTMPVDFSSIDPDAHEALQFDPKRHKSHFSTCPQAGEHRNRR